MMSPEYIASMSRQAARKASREKKYPTLIEQEDIDHAKRSLSIGRTPNLHIPFIGDWHPRGFTRTDNLYFVDSSGFGAPGEPALTQAQFIDKLRPGYAYAVIEAGQFQCYVQEFYSKRTSAVVETVRRSE